MTGNYGATEKDADREATDMLRVYTSTVSYLDD